MKNFKKFKKIADIAFVLERLCILLELVSNRIQLPELEYRTYFLRLALQP